MDVLDTTRPGQDRLWTDLRQRMVAIGCRPGLGPVFGTGNPKARLAIVGEAPGATEAEQGRPFVGAAGRRLDRGLRAAGLQRDQLWITNVVKCRPVREEGERLANRPPTAAEIRCWYPLLEAELLLVAPRLLVCLGAVAGRALIAPDFKLQDDRGRWFPSSLAEMALGTYHPAYLLRLQGEARAEALSAFEADLGRAKEQLAAISPDDPREPRVESRDACVAG
jgi:DNA polymerase